MKAVENLTPTELFDRLSIALYYGMATRDILRTNAYAAKAAQDLLAQLRQDSFLCEKMEQP